MPNPTLQARVTIASPPLRDDTHPRLHHLLEIDVGQGQVDDMLDTVRAARGVVQPPGAHHVAGGADAVEAVEDNVGHSPGVGGWEACV